jgi:hypothetical protein
MGMMSFFINETGNYHREDLETLGWELTVCNTIADPRSVCRRFLVQDASFGELLYQHLDSLLPFSDILSVLEVGGGYGYLMRDFLSCNPALRPVMLDISPLLLRKQQETLRHWNAEFIEKDFFQVGSEFLERFHLAVLNENCGDFPTIVNFTSDDLLCSHRERSTLISRLYRYIKKYDLSIPETDLFNFNLGAVEAVEILCRAGIPFIYISEHSCEAVTPDIVKGMVDITSTGNPERIALKGHDEYTIKFSHLVKVAGHHGYQVRRGQFIDFIRPELSNELRFILTSGSMKSDEHEIVRQFVEDLVKYEYLVLCRDDNSK